MITEGSVGVAGLRRKIPGQYFYPGCVRNPDAFYPELMTLTIKKIKDVDLKSVWDIQHAGDGLIYPFVDWLSFCMKLAHVELLYKYYWRTTNE